METVLLVSSDCSGCETIKQHLTKQGTIDKYRIIDVATEEGANIARKLGIDSVPNCVVIKETPEGKMARLCTETEFAELIKGE